MFRPEVIYSPELNLDSKGICFLCLTKTGGDGENKEEEGTAEENGTVWNLVNISQFLGINLSDKIHQIIPNHPSMRIEWGDVKVHLCTKCNEIGARFVGLFKTLERTKLRLKWCMEQMNRLLETSENDTERMEEVNRTLNGEDENVTLRLLSLLRSEVLEKGSQKIKADHPPRTKPNQSKTFPTDDGVKVEVVDVPIEDTGGDQDLYNDELSDSATPEASAVDEDLMEVTPTLGRENGPGKPSGSLSLNQIPNGRRSKVEVIVVLSETIPPAQAFLGMEATEPEPVPEPSSSVQPAPSIIPGSPPEEEPNPTVPAVPPPPLPSKTSGKVVCRFCSNKIQGRKAYEVELHEVLFHSHQLLEAHRLPHLSEDMFCKIVYYVLFSNIKFTSNGDKKCNCAYCSKELRTSVHGTTPILKMRHHMVKQHPDALSAELRKLQSDPEQVKMKLGTVERKRAFWGKRCVCSCYLMNYQSFVNHCSKYNCKGPRDPPPGSASSNNGSGARGKCSHCKATFPEEEALSTHMIEFHLDNFFGEELRKGDKLDRDTFKILLYHFLFKTLDGFTLNAVDSTKRTWIPCPHCYKTFEYKKESGRQYCPEMRLHFIRDHWKQLLDKLTLLQMNTNVRNKLESFKDVGRVCTSCGDYLATEKLFEEHQKEFCKALEDTAGEGQGQDVHEYGSSLQVLCKGCGEMVTVGDIQEHMTSCPGANDQDQEDDGMDLASDLSSLEGEEEDEEGEGLSVFGYGEGEEEEEEILALDPAAAGQEVKHVGSLTANNLGYDFINENDEEEEPQQRKKIKTEEVLLN